MASAKTIDQVSVVVELILAQQGGIPRFIKPHNVKASVSIVFGQPTKSLDAKTEGIE